MQIEILKINYSAVLSLFLGIACLIAGEFVTISLLTPMATDFGVSSGRIGWSVTFVGIAATLSSLVVAPLTKNIDRKVIFVTLSGLLILSNLIVAISSNLWVLYLTRAMLGVCVGGFSRKCLISSERFAHFGRFCLQ